MRGRVWLGHHLGTWTIRISWDIPTYPDLSYLSATYGYVPEISHQDKSGLYCLWSLRLPD